MFTRMWSFVTGWPFWYRQEKLASNRPSISRDEFIARIAIDGGDRYAAQVVWDTLVADVIEGFTPYPDDSLESVYGVAEEELEVDLLLHLLEESGIPVPEQEFVDQFGPVSSPRLVAKFITACRTHAHAHAGAGGE